MAALGSQSIASSYEQLLHVDADGGGNTTTHVSVKDGDNGTTFALTLATDAVMITSDNRLEFGDDGTYIHQSADGVLDLVSDTEIEINATTVDINGAVDISGTFSLAGTTVSSTAAELNLLDGSSVTNATVSKAVVLDSSGNIALPNGNGISFAATADGTTMSSELLDDYEEGTYTALITCGTSGSITPHTGLDDVAYTKIGRIVHIQAYIDISAISSPVGELRVNLPFASAALATQSDFAYGSVLLDTANLTDATSHGVVMEVGGGGVSYARIKYVKDNASSVNDLAAAVSTSTGIAFGLTYIV